MSEKPENAGAPELTVEMIEAGVKVCADIYGVCSESVAEGLVRDMFMAMMERRSPNQTQSVCRAQTKGGPSSRI
jgi:hypothetical protein